MKTPKLNAVTLDDLQAAFEKLSNLQDSPTATIAEVNSAEAEYRRLTKEYDSYFASEPEDVKRAALEARGYSGEVLEAAIRCPDSEVVVHEFIHNLVRVPEADEKNESIVSTKAEKSRLESELDEMKAQRDRDERVVQAISEDDSNLYFDLLAAERVLESSEYRVDRLSNDLRWVMRSQSHLLILDDMTPPLMVSGVETMKSGFDEGLVEYAHLVNAVRKARNA